MKTIEQKSNTGRFAYTITAEVGDSVNDATTTLCVGGLADAGFRAAGSAVDKALVKAGVATKDTKRSEVDYTEANRAIVAKAAQEALDKLTSDKGYPAMTFEVTGEHVFGESVSAMAMATALVDSFLGTPMEEPYRLILGSAKGDREALIELAHEKKLGIRPAKASK